MCNTRVKQKQLFQIICDVHQILFLLPIFWANHVVLTSKMFFVNLKWVPSKLRLTHVELSRILQAHIYQHTNQPYLRSNGQPNSISMSDDNFKYLAMQLARKFEVSVISFYTKLARVNPNLLIEKNIQLRHTYLKVTAFSIAFSQSRLTRISLVQFCLRNAGSFIESITYHWLCISELINLISFQQTFHVA